MNADATTQHDLPDEVIRQIAVGYSLDGKATELRMCEVRDVLRAAAELGLVLVHGPVKTEWTVGTRPGDAGANRLRTEEIARELASHYALPLASRQVTAWRPAPAATPATPSEPVR
jgi:hypothetical protein